MTKEEALKVLAKMRAWRRWGKGEQNKKDRPEMPEQKEVDEAFDICIEMLSKSTLPSNFDEAVEKYLELPETHSSNQWEDLAIYHAFEAAAEWMSEQGVSMVITDDTEWAEVDKFVHSNCDGTSIIQIRKKD